MTNYNNKTGFTLIELIIVVIIIGVLAAIAAPIMQGTTDKAIKTEAVAALSTIRTAERLYYVEYEQYANVPNFTVSNPLSVRIPAGVLNGLYFSEECYSVTVYTPTTYTIWCSCSSSIETVCTDHGVVISCSNRNFNNFKSV